MTAIKVVKIKFSRDSSYKKCPVKHRLKYIIKNHTGCKEVKETQIVKPTKYINDSNAIYYRLIMEFLNYPDAVQFGHTCRVAHTLLKNTMMYSHIREILQMPLRMNYIEELIRGEDMETIGALIHTSMNFKYHLERLVNSLFKLTHCDDYRCASLKVLIGSGFVTRTNEDIHKTMLSLLDNPDTLEDYSRITYGIGIKTEFMTY